MSGAKALIRSLLKGGDLTDLFVVGLGWDRYGARLDVAAGGRDYALRAIAQKRGMVAYECAAGAAMPDYATRRRIERQVAKSVQEHLIVFTDAAVQVWQWVRREPGRPAACREHWYSLKQTGEALAQKLHAIAFSLEQEDELDIGVVTRGARKGFDVERVTRAFYRDFDTHRKAFLKFIDGIGDVGDCEWYASVMLNRLMFVYFIQRKGFLDGDTNYLRQRLARCKAERGKDKFYSFYRYFLLRLFHDGFGNRQRSAELKALLGNIPYLNGGLFDEHELEKPERYGKNIAIPDKAFERIFDYFDQYQWHLDERPLRADNEINPDVLGYIFEKYINQKQMGAYYTKEDITEYISKNTVLPFIFDAARAKCKVAFENPSGPTVWDLLRENPDRYIYPAVRYGADKLFPAAIAKGLDPKKPNLIERRQPWNKPAPADYALPTEIWREVVARRQRYEEVRRKLAAGEVREVNDFITLNLDLRQYAQDVIQNCEGPDLLMAFWQSITTITVLDPTGGSGAFIFAALNMLDPLYEACLERMEVFLSEWGEHGKKAQPNYHKKFTEVLARVDAHPNRRYFVLKSIILNNLYAVDIMVEAVEICKLRLFLKLAAQVEPDNAKDNLGIEPLPDIDFNIKVGNTLVGFVTMEHLRKAAALARIAPAAAQGKLAFPETVSTLEGIELLASELQQAFAKFRQLQTDGDGSVPAAHKLELQKRLKALEDELNRHLAGEYGVKVSDKAAYSQWVKSHQPFHWFIQFYGILNGGGFDVIIGNPPYVAATKVRRSYAVKNLVTDSCTDIFAWVMERSQNLLRTNGRTGMIVPLSLGFSMDFDSCRRLLFTKYNCNWFSAFARIPAALFAAEVRVRNVIHIGSKTGNTSSYTSRLHRWFEVYRPHLFGAIEYSLFSPKAWQYLVPKINTANLCAAFEKLLNGGHTLESSFSRVTTHYDLHFKGAAYNWLTFCRKEPPCYDENGKAVAHGNFHTLYLRTKDEQELASLLLNGKLIFIYWCIVGDDLNVPRRAFASFPANLKDLTGQLHDKLASVIPELEKVMLQNASFKLNAGKRVGNYNLAKCRTVTDKSDLIIASSLGFSEVWEDLDLYYTQVVRTDFSGDDEE